MIWLCIRYNTDRAFHEIESLCTLIESIAYLISRTLLCRTKWHKETHSIAFKLNRKTYRAIQSTRVK